MALLVAGTVVGLGVTFVSAPPASAHHLCSATGSSLGPFDIQTYEAADYRNTYARTFELAAANRLFPEFGAFALPNMETGDRALGSSQVSAGLIPPVLLKSIAYLESNWAQASYSPFVDYGQTGPVLSSHDCGYGIMQVTSGMQNISGVPNLDQAMIGSSYSFNIARGAKVLADKWNMSPELRPVIGNRDPALVENWYYAIWAYNGWAFQNHPLNPSYSVSRVPYSCGAANDGFGHDRSQYPYQELVLGCSQRPAERAGHQLWAPVEVHLPDLNDAVFSVPLAVENWNACTYSAQCQPMDIPTPNTNHRDPTSLALTREQVLGSPSLGLSVENIEFAAAGATGTLHQSVAISNIGSGALPFRATSNANWLKVTPSAGIALGGDLGARAQLLEVSASASGLPAGTYSAQVKIDSLFPAATRVLTVSFTVTTPFAGERLLGDFNGDGHDDFLQLCCPESVTAWLSRGDGTFEPIPFSPWPGYNTSIGRWQTGDFNGDGSTDLLHLCCTTGAMIWRSDGDGTFSVSQANTGPNYSYLSGTWQRGDFNNDGRDDLVHFCCGTQAYTWFGRADGTFLLTSFQAWEGYGVAGRWEAGDYNGDGRTDLAHLCCADYMHLWMSQGDGRFVVTFEQAWPGYGMGGEWLHGDFNGDSRQDMLHLCCGDYAHLWLGKASGGFDVRFFQPWPGYGMKVGSWESGDLNADGRTDLIHICCSTYLHPWFANADGSFTLAYFQPWPGYGVQVGSWETSDFNGDNRTDLLHFCCSLYGHGWRSLPGGGFVLSAYGP